MNVKKKMAYVKTKNLQSFARKTATSATKHLFKRYVKKLANYVMMKHVKTRNLQSFAKRTKRGKNVKRHRFTRNVERLVTNVAKNQRNA